MKRNKYLPVIVVILMIMMVCRPLISQASQGDYDLREVVIIEVDDVLIVEGMYCSHLVNFKQALDIPDGTDMVLFIEQNIDETTTLGVILPLDMVCWGVNFQTGHVLTPSYFAESRDDLVLLGFDDPIRVELRVIDLEIEAESSDRVKA